MKARMLPLLAGVAVFGIAGATIAGEPTLLTDETLDTIAAGNPSAAAAAIGPGAAAAQAGAVCGFGTCGITDGVTTVAVPGGTIFFAQALGS